MKINKKVAITAIAFTAALNFNACAYGPPPEDYGYSTYRDAQYEKATEMDATNNSIEEDSIDE